MLTVAVTCVWVSEWNFIYRLWNEFSVSKRERAMDMATQRKIQNGGAFHQLPFSGSFILTKTSLNCTKFGSKRMLRREHALKSGRKLQKETLLFIIARWGKEVYVGHVCERRSVDESAWRNIHWKTTLTVLRRLTVLGLQYSKKQVIYAAF